MIATEGRHLLWTLDACDRPTDRPTGNTFVMVVFGMGPTRRALPFLLFACC